MGARIRVKNGEPRPVRTKEEAVFSRRTNIEPQLPERYGALRQFLLDAVDDEDPKWGLEILVRRYTGWMGRDCLPAVLRDVQELLNEEPFPHEGLSYEANICFWRKHHAKRWLLKLRDALEKVLAE
jgi:hypothetical protein